MKPRVAGSSPVGRGVFLVVDVAQLVEHRIVAPMVVGSSPIVHPNFLITIDCYQIKKLDDSELKVSPAMINTE